MSTFCSCRHWCTAHRTHALRPSGGLWSCTTSSKLLGVCFTRTTSLYKGVRHCSSFKRKAVRIYDLKAEVNPHARHCGRPGLQNLPAHAPRKPCALPRLLCDSPLLDECMGWCVLIISPLLTVSQSFCSLLTDSSTVTGDHNAECILCSSLAGGIAAAGRLTTVTGTSWFTIGSTSTCTWTLCKFYIHFCQTTHVTQSIR